ARRNPAVIPGACADVHPTAADRTGAEQQERGQSVTDMSMAIDDGTAPGDTQPWNSDEPAEDENCSLFEGDLGQLADGDLRALVVILKRRYVSAERDPDVWRILVENRIALETRLNDMFLQLVVDRDYGVAYKRQAVPDGGGTFPTLLHNAAYSREQTILMV